MADYYIQEFENYVEDLCELHVNVLHHATERVAFVRLESGADIDAIRNNPGKDVIVVMSDFNGRAVGELETLKMRQVASMYFAAYCPVPSDGNMRAAISAALSKSYTVMMDFLARMITDFHSDQCGALKYLQAQNASWDLIPEQPWLENHYGWELTLPFGAKLPAYNPVKFGEEV